MLFSDCWEVPEKYSPNNTNWEDDRPTTITPCDQELYVNQQQDIIQEEELSDESQFCIHQRRQEEDRQEEDRQIQSAYDRFDNAEDDINSILNLLILPAPTPLLLAPVFDSINDFLAEEIIVPAAVGFPRGGFGNFVDVVDNDDDDNDSLTAPNNNMNNSNNNNNDCRIFSGLINNT